MATVKKSLTVNELANIIRKSPSKSAKELMKALRVKYTFSKDKWNAARKLITAVKAENSVKPIKKPTKATATIECICDDCKSRAEDEFFAMIDATQDEAKDFVGEFFAELKAKCMKNPCIIGFIPACCNTKSEVLRLLDMGVENGLLEKRIGYTLSDAAIKTYAKKRTKGDIKSKAKKSSK